MTFEQQTIDEFERAGVRDVRLRVQAGLIALDQLEIALRWIREKEAEAARQAESRRIQEALTANAEKKALARSNRIIMVISGLTFIVSLLSWLFPKR
jgi:hypothetical protein